MSIIALVGLFFIGNFGTVSALSLSDVKLQNENSDAYFGPVYKEPNVNGPVSLQPADIDNALSQNWTWSTETKPLWGSSFTYLTKNDGSSTIEGALNYFTFWISDINFATTGSFKLNWSSTEQAVVPAYFDFIFGLKSSTAYALYFFDDVTIPLAASGISPYAGSYTISFNNASSQALGALSGLSVYGRPGTAVVPEPATMLLFGTGLAGLAAVARRRKN